MIYQEGRNKRSFNAINWQKRASTFEIQSCSPKIGTEFAGVQNLRIVLDDIHKLVMLKSFLIAI